VVAFYAVIVTNLPYYLTGDEFRIFLNLHTEKIALYALLFAKLPYYVSDISVRNFLNLH